VVPGVGGQVAPFDVQVHGGVVEEVPQRDGGEGGAEFDLVVPRLGGGIHRGFDAGGRPFDQPGDGAGVVAHVCHDVPAGPAGQQRVPVEYCVG
jgi:hypothetical protein